MTASFRFFFWSILSLGLVPCLLFNVGCSKAPPKTVTSVTGVVTINGTPLPKAEVTFIPLTEGLDGNYIASGISDDNGQFTLAFPGGKAGAVLGEHIVTVMEGPMPEEFRGQDGDSQLAAGNYMNGLLNRPIPEAYTLSSLSPLRITTTEGQASYPIALTRLE